jgi:hypothetical protein
MCVGRAIVGLHEKMPEIPVLCPERYRKMAAERPIITPPTPDSTRERGVEGGCSFDIPTKL